LTVSTLKIGKQEYVVVPRKEFDRLRRQAEDLSEQDRGDVAEAKRRQKEPSVSLEQVRKRLGL
jgi:hypothetical protein